VQISADTTATEEEKLLSDPNLVMGVYLTTVAPWGIPFIESIREGLTSAGSDTDTSDRPSTMQLYSDARRRGVIVELTEHLLTDTPKLKVVGHRLGQSLVSYVGTTKRVTRLSLSMTHVSNKAGGVVALSWFA